MAEAGQALHVLDRFHITTNLNQAVDRSTAPEGARLRAVNQEQAQKLKYMRWSPPRRRSRVRGRGRQKLDALLAGKQATAHALKLKETFSHFWRRLK